MNLFLWILQVLFAIHTIMGAVWKRTNPEQTVPSLQALPHQVWLALSGLELIAAVALILPAFNKRLGYLVPWPAGFIIAEMVLFCVIHLASGDSNYGPMYYWLVVAGICAYLAYARWKHPIRP